MSALCPTTRINERVPHLQRMTEADVQKIESACVPDYRRPSIEEQYREDPESFIFDPNFRRIGYAKMATGELIDIRVIKDPEVEDALNLLAYKVDDYVACCNYGYLCLAGFPDPSQDHLWVNKIYTGAHTGDYRFKIKGLGTTLIQLAIEISLSEGRNGNVKLRSTNASSVFYYKLGFDCKYPPLQQRVHEAYQRNVQGPDGGDMSLSPEAIECWKEKIAAFPIMQRPKKSQICTNKTVIYIAIAIGTLLALGCIFAFYRVFVAPSFR